jgi:hypothetical protein
MATFVNAMGSGGVLSSVLVLAVFKYACGFVVRTHTLVRFVVVVTGVGSVASLYWSSLTVPEGVGDRFFCVSRQASEGAVILVVCNTSVMYIWKKDHQEN